MDANSYPLEIYLYEVFNKFSSNWSGATTAVLVLYTGETVRFGPEDKQLWLGESVLRAEYSLHLVTLLGLLFMGPMIPEHSETPCCSVLLATTLNKVRQCVQRIWRVNCQAKISHGLSYQ